MSILRFNPDKYETQREIDSNNISHLKTNGYAPTIIVLKKGIGIDITFWTTESIEEVQKKIDEANFNEQFENKLNE